MFEAIILIVTIALITALVTWYEWRLAQLTGLLDVAAGELHDHAETEAWLRTLVDNQSTSLHSARERLVHQQQTITDLLTDYDSAVLRLRETQRSALPNLLAPMSDWGIVVNQ